MKKTQGILFLLAFVLVGSLFTTPIYGRVVTAISKGGPSGDVRTLSENDGCDEDDDDDDDHAE